MLDYWKFHYGLLLYFNRNNYCFLSTFLNLHQDFFTIMCFVSPPASAHRSKPRRCLPHTSVAKATDARPKDVLKVTNHPLPSLLHPPLSLTKRQCPSGRWGEAWRTSLTPVNQTTLVVRPNTVVWVDY